jgi:hypothetical protein
MKTLSFSHSRSFISFTLSKNHSVFDQFMGLVATHILTVSDKQQFVIFVNHMEVSEFF